MLRSAYLLFFVASIASVCSAQDAAPVAETPSAPPAVSTDTPKVGEASDSDAGTRLALYLSGCKFVGKFTIDGKDNAKTEEYTISKCEKLADPDMYRLTARIKYGDIDSELPLELPIRWSGNTPVITLDNFWIPGMGTFSARVLLHSDRYAGTWQHDAVGGHMFGKIERVEK